MHVNDVIGRRGELIAILALTLRYRQGLPRFNVRFLGEKAEVVDLLVELIGVSTPRHFFLAQVKSTGIEDVTEHTDTLPISVSHHAYRALCGYQVPAYLIGVDEVNSGAFLLGLDHGRKQGFAGFPKQFPLTSETLEGLFDEVREFWEQWRPEPHRTRFLAPTR